MNLDTFIVERVIGLVDVAEHNAASLSVSVLTTAPAISQARPCSRTGSHAVLAVSQPFLHKSVHNSATNVDPKVLAGRVIPAIESTVVSLRGAKILMPERCRSGYGRRARCLRLAGKRGVPLAGGFMGVSCVATRPPERQS
jgi:hypothetical protein